jgi:glycosyltransferase involved in cell wall biosynthesis
MHVVANRTTLFISNVEWSFVWQRHQTLATLFARDGEVVFCEVPGIRRLKIRDAGRVGRRLLALRRRGGAGKAALTPGLRVIRPFLLPATNRLFCAINGWLLARFVRREAVLSAGVDLIINYSPTRSARQLIEGVSHRRFVYDCTNDWLAVQGAPSTLRDDERWLLNHAAITFVSSERLRARKAIPGRPIEVISEGVLIERFILPEKPVPAAGQPRTLIYYGHLHSQHLDFALIDAVAMRQPEWRIMLIGPVKTPHAFPPNVMLIGQQPHERLRDFLRRADVIFLPYVLNDYTTYVFPAKMYECLATAMPVVATPISELVAHFDGLIEFGTRAEEIIGAVEKACRHNTPELRDRKRMLARANTWEQRYGHIRTLLAGLDAKEAGG